MATPTTDAADGAPNLDWRVDLLRPVDELIGILADEVRTSSYLNAYLLTVAMQQVGDDYLVSVPVLDRATAFVGDLGSVWGNRINAVMRPMTKAAQFLRSAIRRRHGFADWKTSVDTLVGQLASVVISGPPGSENIEIEIEIESRVRSLVAWTQNLSSSFRNSLPVIPSCFQTFDLQLTDIERLAERVLEELPAPEPIVIVGVRTSGSYLAPLLAARMRALGRTDISTTTLRPRVHLQGQPAKLIGDASAEGARFIVADDPPASGSSIRSVMRELQRIGVPEERITPSFPCFTKESGDLRHLIGLRWVCLPWEDWAVHERLTEPAVMSELATLLGDEVRLLSVTTVTLRQPARNDPHVRGHYRVEVADRTSSTVRTLNIAVQGVGIGYFGEHVAIVGEVMADYGPHIYGLRSGLLYREWFDDADRVTGSSGATDLAAGLAAYAAERSRRLRVSADRSRQLGGSQPAWEAAAIEMSRAFGRAWPVAQILAVNPLVRRLMRVPNPTVVDGTTDLENWFRGDRSGVDALRSAGMQRRAYWHLGLGSYDPVFDLAGTMDDDFDVPDARTMLDTYAVSTGDSVSPERWMLLRMSQLWGCRRRGADPVRLRRARSRVLQEYFASVFLHDLDAPLLDGPVVALDVDGVLETDHLGFPSLTAASALALRGLRKHGYRPVLVTGRSVDEVRERCRSYGLVGGVAEYGSAIVLTSTDTVINLVGPAEHEELVKLRNSLALLPDVVVDECYRIGVRARNTAAGASGGLSIEQVRTVLVGRHDLRAVHGEGQTDFISGAVDKRTGLVRLMAELFPDSAPGLQSVPELAIGDTASDCSMLAFARSGAIPAHALPGLDRPGIWRAKSRYQEGMAQAVDRFLGHTERAARFRTGATRCPMCRYERTDRARDALLLFLSVNESGPAGVPSRVFRGLFSLAIPPSLRLVRRRVSHPTH